MTMMRGPRARPASWFAITLSIVILAFGADRATAELSHVVRLGVGFLEPRGSLSGAGETAFSIGVLELVRVDNRYEVESQSAIAPFISYELRTGDRIGLELATSLAGSDLEVGIARDGVVTHNDTGELLRTFTETDTYPGEIDFVPVTLGLNFHLFPRKPYDLSVGPLVGYVLYDDIRFSPAPERTVTVGTEDDLAYGAAIGLDLPLGAGGWLFSGSVRILRSTTQPEFIPEVFQSKFFPVADFAPGELSIDPVVVRVGLARRFGR